MFFSFFIVLTFNLQAQYFVGLNYSPNVSYSEQFATSLVSESAIIPYLTHGFAICFSKKLKKKNIELETGYRHNTYKVGIHYNEDIPREDKGFSKQIFQWYQLKQIPFIVNYTFKNQSTEKKDKSQKETEKEPFCSIGGGLIFCFDAIVQYKDAFEEKIDIAYGGKTYSRNNLLLGGANGALNTFLINYNFTYHYPLKKYSEIYLALEHNVGLKPIVGANLIVGTSIDGMNPIKTNVVTSSTGSSLGLRIGYRYRIK